MSNKATVLNKVKDTAANAIRKKNKELREERDQMIDRVAYMESIFKQLQAEYANALHTLWLLARREPDHTIHLSMHEAEAVSREGNRVLMKRNDELQEYELRAVTQEEATKIVDDARNDPAAVAMRAERDAREQRIAEGIEQEGE